MNDNSFDYNRVAKFLHWLLALAIIGMIGLGWYMTNAAEHDPNRGQWFQLHKSIGITILLLSLFRLAWRLMHKPPPLPAIMPDWEKFAAHAVHILFYILIIGIPLTGWIIVSCSPIPTVLYDIIPWPHLPILPDLENKRDIGHTFGRLHGLLAYLIAGLLVLHIGAAWKHHLINRDDVLLRMAPRFMHPFLNKIRGH